MHKSYIVVFSLGFGFLWGFLSLDYGWTEGSDNILKFIENLPGIITSTILTVLSFLNPFPDNYILLAIGTALYIFSMFAIPSLILYKSSFLIMKLLKIQVRD